MKFSQNDIMIIIRKFHCLHRLFEKYAGGVHNTGKKSSIMLDGEFLSRTHRLFHKNFIRNLFRFYDNFKVQYFKCLFKCQVPYSKMYRRYTTELHFSQFIMLVMLRIVLEGYCVSIR